MYLLKQQNYDLEEVLVCFDFVDATLQILSTNTFLFHYLLIRYQVGTYL